MQDLVLSTCTVDLQRRRVHRGETVTRLTSTEAALLSFLMSHPNELISRDALHTAVWGYADGVMSRAVDTAIRRLRKKVERDPRQPDHVLTVYGEGYTFVPSVRAASHGPAAVEAQVSEADGPTANSQAASDGGVLGREQELSTLVQRLSCGGLTTVVGPGGMGKSYLVAAVLEQHGSDLTGGHWLVPLSSIEESACLLNKLAETLGVVLGPALDQRAATALIASALASRGETLLVLDDFDSLIESASQAIEDLLAGAPQLRLFITSRTRPSSGLGEVVTLDSMPTHAARHMFIEQVSRLRPGYSPDEDTLQTIDALVDRLDGLPLAIELAAARLRMMTPEQMLIRLSESYSILSSHRADAAARHQGIDAMMSLSWGEVTPDERKVLAGFTYFRGGCTLEALEAVLGMVGVSGSLIDLVEGLVDASWLRFEERGGVSPTVRFKMYETIRTFVERQPETEACRETASRAHADWYLAQGQLRVEDLYTRRSLKDMAWLAAERGNLLMCAARAPEEEAETQAQATRLVILGDVARGSILTLRPLLEQPLALREGANPLVMAHYFSARLRALRFLPFLRSSGDDVTHALAAAEASGDVDAICEAHLAAAWAAWDEGKVQEAEEHLENVGQLEAEAPSIQWTLQGYLLSMQMKQRTGDLQGARHIGIQGLEIASAQGQEGAQAQLHHNFAVLDRDLGRIDSATHHAGKARDLYTALDCRVDGAFVTCDLGMLYALRERSEEALEHLKRAQQSFENMHMGIGCAVTLGNQGTIHMMLGDLETAEALLQRSLDQFIVLGNKRDMTFYQAYMGALRGLRGSRKEATDLLTEARRSLHESRYAWADAFMDPLQAHLCIGEALRAEAAGDAEERKTQLETAASALSDMEAGLQGQFAPAAVQWSIRLLLCATRRAG